MNPNLVVRDQKGEIYSVRYHAVNAMLLNEFLKEHRRVEELQSPIAQQRKTTEAVVARLNEQEAKIRQVSDQMKIRTSGWQAVVDNR